MNIYFFLDHSDSNSSIDIFNFPPNFKFCKDTLRDIYPYAFYSNGEEWKYFELAKIKKNESRIIKKDDLPFETKNKSVFVSFSFKPNEFNKSLENLNYMNSSPQWRSNTKIYNNFTSTSYQGEYPVSILSKKISLVSCSPMIQSNFDTYFYMVNLTDNPKKIEFDMCIMNTEFKKLANLKCLTNTINIFDLNKLDYKFTDNFYVFKSDEFGGVPLYFTISQDRKRMGIEHTHPPLEYIFSGNRSHFQKLKKKHWLNEEFD